MDGTTASNSGARLVEGVPHPTFRRRGRSKPPTYAACPNATLTRKPVGSAASNLSSAPSNSA